ncbi:hypothetical protein N7G274_003929 [Stereocaulon virgatum]|uniref:Uncharacterized protein n=1 Tax=Stereocaulon virgatum TaxID=373712 RepID=A0ABR4AGB5_9LECA
MHLVPVLSWILYNLVIHGGAITNAQTPNSFDSNSVTLAVTLYELPASDSIQALITGSVPAPMTGNTSMATEIAATASFPGMEFPGMSSTSAITTMLYAKSNSTVYGNATGLKTTKSGAPAPTSSMNGFAVPSPIPLAAAGMVGLICALAAL